MEHISHKLRFCIIKAVERFKSCKNSGSDTHVVILIYAHTQSYAATSWIRATQTSWRMTSSLHVLAYPLFFSSCSQPSCQKPVPVSFVSQAAWNGKTDWAKSLRCWLAARKKRQRKKKMTVSPGSSWEFSTAVASSPTVRYLSSSDWGETMTALKASHEAAFMLRPASTAD